jgi:hypothetical protein
MIGLTDIPYRFVDRCDPYKMGHEKEGEERWCLYPEQGYKIIFSPNTYALNVFQLDVCLLDPDPFLDPEKTVTHNIYDFFESGRKIVNADREKRKYFHMWNKKEIDQHYYHEGIKEKYIALRQDNKLKFLSYAFTVNFNRTHQDIRGLCTDLKIDNAYTKDAVFMRETEHKQAHRATMSTAEDGARNHAEKIFVQTIMNDTQLRRFCGRAHSHIGQSGVSPTMAMIWGAGRFVRQAALYQADQYDITLMIRDHNTDHLQPSIKANKIKPIVPRQLPLVSLLYSGVDLYNAKTMRDVFHEENQKKDFDKVLKYA